VVDEVEDEVEDEAVDDNGDGKNTRFLKNNFKRKRGPRTPQGKARVARNATKYGVFAKTPVLPLVEDENEWQALRRDVIDVFGLEGPFQEALGERAAFLVWRLKRVARMETEEVRHYQADVPEDWVASMRMQGLPIPDRETREQVEEMRRMLMARLLPGEEVMEKMLTYESRLNRYFLQSLYTIMVLKGFITPRDGRIRGVAELGPPQSSRRVGLPPGDQPKGGHSKGQAFPVE
jgi:hypothetical protein